VSISEKNEEDFALDLPAHESDSADDEHPIDGALTTSDLELPHEEGDLLDDRVADDLPVEIDIDTDEQEPTALDDDSTGLDGVDSGSGIVVDEGEASMLDPDVERDGLAAEDNQLGIDLAPCELDDGGHEGLDDPTNSHVDTGAFPPLDGDDDDENDADEIDIGFKIE